MRNSLSQRRTFLPMRWKKLICFKDTTCTPTHTHSAFFPFNSANPIKSMAPTHPWVFIFNWRCFAIHGAAAGAVFAPTQGSKRIKIEARRAIQENWKWDGELFVLSASAFLLFFASALKASSPSSPPAVFHFNFLEESNNTFAFKSFRSTPKCGGGGFWKGGNAEREKLQTIFTSMDPEEWVRQ